MKKGVSTGLGKGERRLILLGLILGISSPASAGTFSCPMFAALTTPSDGCDDNVNLSQAALDCVQGYYNHVQAAQADVLAKFQEQVIKQKQLQNDSYDRTEEGYKNARKQLADLIAQGKAARASVDDLYLNFYFPSDYDEPELTGMSPRDYLSSQACYAQPERVVQQCQMMIDKIMADLAATEQAAFGKQSHSANRSDKVQAVEKNNAVSNTYGKGAGKVPSGNHRVPASDITGTKPLKK